MTTPPVSPAKAPSKRAISAAPAAATKPSRFGRAKDSAQGPADPTPAPTKLQRRPLFLILAVLVIALGGVLGGWVFTTTSDAQPVLAMRTDVARGQVIEPGDLVEARITLDPALQAVPAASIDTVVGNRASVDLPAGGILTDNSYAPNVVPAPGQAVVGIALTAAQMPTQPLEPGARVRIIATPRQQDDPPSSVADGIEVTVISARVDTAETGLSVVDVSVPTGQAPTLAALTATGRVALILDGVG